MFMIAQRDMPEGILDTVRRITHSSDTLYYAGVFYLLALSAKAKECGWKVFDGNNDTEMIVASIKEYVRY